MVCFDPERSIRQTNRAEYWFLESRVDKGPDFSNILLCRFAVQPCRRGRSDARSQEQERNDER